MTPAAKIFLINVGANTAHSSKARSPLFPNGEFMFIPFPDPYCSDFYTRNAWPFVCDPESLTTHADPDWRNLTYGDNCHNRRAKALLGVERGHILLFWGLFWKVARNGRIFDVQLTKRRWCLIGGLTVAYVVKAERGRDVVLSDFIKDNEALRRATKNVHVLNGKLPRITSERHDVLFVGDPARSARFDRAVDLEIYHDSGLLQETILSKNLRQLRWDRSPRWNSSLRPCRSVLDLSRQADCRRAKLLGSAIRASNPQCRLIFNHIQKGD
jgi:Nucleotide modification associated domain 3